VFANLLGNSLEAMPAGGTIKIRNTMRMDWAIQRWCFRVTIADNGRGIPKAMEGQIFEPFFTTKGSDGTGQRLWVTKQILEKHHGSFKVRSKAEGPKTGTEFRITFPRRDFVLHEGPAMNRTGSAVHPEPILPSWTKREAARHHLMAQPIMSGRIASSMSIDRMPADSKQ
jgi:hypothetical protein